MAQQAYRRTKRGIGRQGAFWKGLLAAIGFTLAAVIVFALVLSFADVSDGVIRVVNQVIKVAAIFIGVWIMVPCGSENGIRKGALLGIVYMGAGVLLYAVLSGQKLTVMGYLMDVLMGLAAGGLSGMLVSARK